MAFIRFTYVTDPQASRSACDAKASATASGSPCCCAKKHAATALARKNVPALALKVKAPFAATLALPNHLSFPGTEPPRDRDGVDAPSGTALGHAADEVRARARPSRREVHGAEGGPAGLIAGVRSNRAVPVDLADEGRVWPEGSPPGARRDAEHTGERRFEAGQLRSERRSTRSAYRDVRRCEADVDVLSGGAWAATKNAGISSSRPAALKASTQVAATGVEATHASRTAAETWPGAATRTWPSSSRSSPARSSALTTALTWPRAVPGAWLVVTCVSDGTMICSTAVGSSLGSTDTLIVVVVPACVASNVGDVYAGVRSRYRDERHDRADRGGPGPRSLHVATSRLVIALRSP